MRLLAGLIALGVRNPVMANLAMICILVGGFLYAQGMLREAYPAFSLDHIAVDVVYPGASPEDVEESITIKIEEAIEGLPGIREVSSVSFEGRCSVFAALQTGADSGRLLKDVQDQVERITTFPFGMEEPVVAERLVRNQVINIAISGDVPERTLKSLAETVRDDLITDPDLSQISLVGVRDYEISIEVSEEALQRYGLSFNEVIAAVRRGSLDLPAGTVRTTDAEVILRTIGQRYTGAEFEQLVVISSADGTLIRLGQIATVRDGFEEESKRGWFNGRPAAMVAVYKTEDQDTSTIARKVREYVAGQQGELPEGISVEVWADNSHDVDGRIAMLIGNGVAGIILVVVALALFLNLRLSLWVAVGIPVSVAGAMVILGATDQTLNMISLMGLIMATGIIVDDAIVIAENIHTRKLAGGDPAEAAVEGAAEMALPVLGSSATTVLAFAPLLFVSGVMGKFIFVLPVVVIAAIAASSFEAFGILPAHLRHGEGVSVLAGVRAKVRARLDAALVAFVERVYEPALRAVVRGRSLTLAAALAAFLVTAGLVGGGRVPFVLFPKGESNLLRARIRFPEGTASAVTEAAVRRIERAAWALNERAAVASAEETPPVRQVFSNVGERVGFATETGSHLGEVTVGLRPSEDRRLTGAELLELWRTGVGTIHDAVSVEMTQLAPGPTEKPLEVRLHGDDLDQLARAADEVGERLASYGGTREIDADLKPGKLEMRVSLKPIARTLGLAEADLAAQLREGFFGGEAVRVLREGEEVKVQVRYPLDERRALADVGRMRVRTASGEEIPFSEAATVETARGYSSIWRQDGARRVRVWADVDERLANTEEILHDMTAGFLPDLEQRYRAEDPLAGFSYSLGGQRAEMQESLSSLVQGMVMALVAIYAVLASMLRSYTQPAIIMAAIPLGAVGAVVGHRIMGYDLTIMSVFGAVALSGVVVNDALVLLVQLNRLVGAGRPVFEAIVETGKSRFRAVILTSVTTVAGLTPLLLERATQAQQLIPMVISLTFGLMFATVLTLLVVPALYLVVNDVHRAVRWLRRGGAYPSPEAVVERLVDSGEPAAV